MKCSGAPTHSMADAHLGLGGDTRQDSEILLLTHNQWETHKTPPTLSQLHERFHQDGEHMANVCVLLFRGHCTLSTTRAESLGKIESTRERNETSSGNGRLWK